MSSGTKITASTEPYSDKLRRLRRALSEAEAVLVGAGAGLSTSAGFTYSGARFRRYFADFAAKYHFADMYSGGFYPYPSPEALWAFWSRNIYINRYVDPPRPVYRRLLELVKDRDYFVLTTNVDHCFQRAGFDKERLFYTQGDYGLWQCSLPCRAVTYDNEAPVRNMLAAQGFTFGRNGELIVPEEGPASAVPSELIPRCPICGRPMTMNLRVDERFVEDAGWQTASKRYADFLEQHRDRRVLFLEAAVGYNTPGIIKYPFRRMTRQWPQAVYACLNRGEAEAPPEIADRSICIDGDVGELLEQLTAER